MSIKNRPYFVRADKWNDFLNHKTDDETLERCKRIDRMINMDAPVIKNRSKDTEHQEIKGENMKESRMNPFDDFDFDDIGISPEDVFESLSDAEQVVERAKQQLYDLLKEDIKSTLQEAASARKELSSLKNEIVHARYEAGKWDKKIEEEKARFEQSKDYDIPKMYLDRIVRNLTGNFAPGDTVYVIKKGSHYGKCQKCKGTKKVDAIIDGKTVSVSCPTCDGRGRITIYDPPIVVEKKVTKVQLRLCFEKDQVCPWNKENVFLNGEEWSTNPKKIYRTPEEARAAMEGEQNG